jgi:hypothetical protein
MTAEASSLPLPLPLATDHLFDLRLTVSDIMKLGGPEGGERRLGAITDGTFRGSQLSGRVRAGGSDLQTVHSAAMLAIDARLALEADDGALLGLTYTGVRQGPAEIMARIAAGQDVDPESYYFRITGVITTPDPRYAWLTGRIFIGVGHRLPLGPVYSIYLVG